MPIIYSNVSVKYFDSSCFSLKALRLHLRYQRWVSECTACDFLPVPDENVFHCVISGRSGRPAVPDVHFRRTDGIKLESNPEWGSELRQGENNLFTDGNNVSSVISCFAVC